LAAICEQDKEDDCANNAKGDLIFTLYTKILKLKTGKKF